MSKSIIDKIVQKFNSEDVIKFSDKDGFKDIKSWAHTGSPTLDYNLRTFGLPTGIIEIAGKSRSGKTTLGLMAMKYFLQENPDDGIAVILSSENRDNKDYALQLGLPVSRIIIVKVKYVEAMFMQVKKLIMDADEVMKEMKMKPKFFFLWDSLGATLSKSELDTMEENTKRMEKELQRGTEVEDIELKNEKMMAFAKEAKKFAKSIMSEMYTHVMHFVMLNHQYEQSTMGVTTRKSTGGEWVELMPTLRLSMKLKNHEKIDDVEVAQITEVKVVKNDFGSRKKTDIRILLGYGIILSQDDIDYALENGILKKEGAKKVSFMNGRLSWSSPRELFNLYYEHNKMLKVLYNKIKKSMQSDLVALKESLAKGLEEEEDDE
nr:MAG TPA: Protein recA [Caudoviricetes sp.]